MHANPLGPHDRTSLFKGKRLGLILLLALASCVVLIWLILSPGITARLGRSQLFFCALGLLCLLPLYPLYRLRRRWPKFSSAIGLLAIGLVLTFISIVVKSAFHASDGWMNYLVHISETLFLLCSILFIWRAVRN
jgi:hypothetical protein